MEQNKYESHTALRARTPRAILFGLVCYAALVVGRYANQDTFNKLRARRARRLTPKTNCAITSSG